MLDLLNEGKVRLLTLTLVLFGLIIGSFISDTTVQASAWHHYIPKTYRGYWHSNDGYTFIITKHNFFNRISGWNKIGHHKFRYPLHGYTHAAFKGRVTQSMKFKMYDGQVGRWSYIAMFKDQHSKLSFAYYSHGGFGDYYTVHRGNR